MRQILVIKNLLLSVREVYSQSAPGYYSVRQVLQSVTDCHYASGITK